MNPIRAHELAPWSTGWEPMPSRAPKLRTCPVCHSVPLWRHMLRCYWVVCTTCGLSTSAFKVIDEAAAVWNIGSDDEDRVDGMLEITEQNLDEIVNQVTGMDL